MENYDLTYEGSRVQGILDTGNSLKDAGYIFRGEATPSTVPGTPTERVAYIGGPGTYTNFGDSITVGAGCICVFKYTGSAWSNQVINTGLSDAISSAINSEATTRSDADTALQNAINSEATTRSEADTALQNAINSEATTRSEADTALQNAITAINNNIGNGYVFAGVATPSTSPVTGKVFYLAVQAGTYTNFEDSEETPLAVTAGINILKNTGTGWVLDQVIAIDAEPTQGSDNLVKSGGVLNSIIQNGPAFDLSAYNAQDGVLATYADLNAALTALNALPADFKQPGMSFKFVLTSDNKYVQFRCKTQSFSTNPEDWAFDGEDTLVENPKWIQIVVDDNEKILYGIKSNGNFYFGAGCPQQIRKYVLEHIDIIYAELSTKVDKEVGKSLINADFAASSSMKENSKYIQVTTDSEEKILEGITKYGVKKINIELEVPSIKAKRAIFEEEYIGGYNIAEKFSNQEEQIANRSKVFPFTPDFNLSRIPELTGEQKFVNTNDLSVLYGLYDELMTQYPNYISKIDMSDADQYLSVQRPAALDGLPIYMYHFKPIRFKNIKNNTDDGRRFVVYINCGTHPDEKFNLFTVFYMMKMICENWKNDVNAEMMRTLIDIYVVPCNSPYGFAHNGETTGISGVTYGRVNENLVNLNRNYPVDGWAEGGQGTSDYTGTAGGSEYETQLTMYYVNLLKPKVFLDAHTPLMDEPWRDKGTVIIDGDYSKDIGMAVCATTNSILCKENSDYPDLENRCLYTVLYGYSKGAAAQWVWENGGCTASTLEGASNNKWHNKVWDANDNERFTNRLMRENIQFYFNWLLRSIRAMCEMYYWIGEEHKV